MVVEDVKSYSGHSFRRGGAQSLFDAGLDISDIQTLGRWKTDLVARRYFGMTKERLSEISKLMTSTTSSRPLQFESLKPATKTLPVFSTLLGVFARSLGRLQDTNSYLEVFDHFIISSLFHGLCDHAFYLHFVV